jgi:type III secretory pathway lipoprotein EscJ
VTHNADGEIEGVKYDRVAVVLINAVKEQQAQIERQQAEINSLRKLVCSSRRHARVCK